MDTLSLFGHDLFGNQVKQPKSGPLAERFEFPPFTVLNGRDADWQERKRAWIALGIQSELGRAVKDGAAANLPNLAEALRLRREGVNADAHYDATYPWRSPQGEEAKNVSVFDPVLCELAYRWFCPTAGLVLDPFAGGSVRGIVAGWCGYRYHGIDLNEAQVAANRAQREAIVPSAGVEWVAGDSLEHLHAAPEADFIFTCPPYGDLERYSDDPRDISTYEYHTFVAAFRRILWRAIQRLRNNRLAALVVGDFRDRRTGMYRGFLADTVTAFGEMGMPLYNEAIFVTPVGSLPIRITKQFEAGLKLGKTHQNLLVFAKGDPRGALGAGR